MFDYQSCLLKPDNPDLMYNRDCLSTYLNKPQHHWVIVLSWLTISFSFWNLTTLTWCTIMTAYQPTLIKNPTSLSHCTVMVDYQSYLLKPDNPDLMYSHDWLSTYLNKKKITESLYCHGWLSVLPFKAWQPWSDVQSWLLSTYLNKKII